MRVPRWRTRIVPERTCSPPNRLTPKRCDWLSRPLRLQPPPFFWAISDQPFFFLGLLGAGLRAAGLRPAGLAAAGLAEADLAGAGFDLRGAPAVFLATGFPAGSASCPRSRPGTSMRSMSTRVYVWRCPSLDRKRFFGW